MENKDYVFMPEFKMVTLLLLEQAFRKTGEVGEIKQGTYLSEDFERQLPYMEIILKNGRKVEARVTESKIPEIKISANVGDLKLVKKVFKSFGWIYTG